MSLIRGPVLVVVSYYDARRVQDLDALLAGLDADGLADPQVAPLAPLPAHAGLFEHLQERPPAAVQDGHLEVVDLDDHVVDAHAVEDAEQVLGGGDQNPLVHEAGGVAHPRHVAPLRRHGEAAEIGPAEDDARARRGRTQPDRNGRAAVQPDSAHRDWFLECLFYGHSPAPPFPGRPGGFGSRPWLQLPHFK